jgi:hypothetical protein
MEPSARNRNARNQNAALRTRAVESHKDLQTRLEPGAGKDYCSNEQK